MTNWMMIQAAFLIGGFFAEAAGGVLVATGSGPSPWRFGAGFLDDFYARFSAVIDLAIYGLVFVGLAQATLGRHYQGRGGRAMAAGVGTALALAMALASERWDFTIRSLGPLAAGFLILVFTALLYRLLRHAGARSPTSLALAYALLFLGLLLLAPDAYLWFAETAPGLATALSLLFGVALLGLMAGVLFHGSRHGERRLEREIERALRRDRQGREAPRALRTGRRLLRRRLRPKTRRFARENERLLDDLESVEKEVRRGGGRGETRRRIVERLKSMSPTWQKERSEIQHIREATRLMRESDGVAASEVDGTNRSEQSPAARRLLTEEARSRAMHLDLDRKAERIEAAIKADVERVFRHVTQAAEHLEGGRVRDALGEIDEAIQAEQSLAELGRALREIWEYLIRMTNAETAIEKKLEAPAGKS